MSHLFLQTTSKKLETNLNLIESLRIGDVELNNLVQRRNVEMSTEKKMRNSDYSVLLNVEIEGRDYISERKM